MPITQSAKKALRQSKKRHVQNLAKKTAFKNAVKEFKKLVSAKKMDGAKAMLTNVYQTLDKAAKINAIAKNTASRIKSRMAMRLKVK